MLRRLLLPLFLVAFTSQFALSSDDVSYDDGAMWADFGLGSWKLVRVYRQKLDEKGTVESVSIDETRSTLVEVTENGYTIRADVVIEVAGRRFEAEPKYFKKFLNGQSDDRSVEVRDAGEGEVEITGQLYPTQVREILVHGKDLERRTLVYYSDDVAPYVLRMETTSTDTKEQRTNSKSVVQVVAVDMPHKVLSEIKTASHVQTSENRHTSGEQRVTVEIQCPSVPGWVVAHSSTLFDKKNDRITERTTLELLDYEVKPAQKGSRRLMSRRRERLRRNRGRR